MKDKIKRLIGRMYTSGAHTNAHELTSKVLGQLNLNEEWSQYVDIEVRNMMDREAFKKTPIHKRALFLPHCLRKAGECKGEYGDRGLKCKKCGKCNIADIIEYAEKLGYQIYVVPGGSLVFKVLKNGDVDAVVGVACYDELDQAIKKANQAGLPSQGILLSEDGCVNTKVNKMEVARKLQL
ncbi:Metal binding protein, component of redox complex [Methanonatronarchaeum thermophilum]|uniref:Metal binding protein, component of redox complex n=1 Tax=Methanonatronarchaeum thermophilum TaxID=1927129 RepID=A0A1Y3GIN3_9EURY|nr:DUF116 domain-containing protein [Methanonatronarchaeum thermophilum]OUJ19256.1 Metal binding protein, component of redox complex [Methanonatronarchaeum thermophilum]